MDKLLRDKKMIIIFVGPALLLFTLIMLMPIVMLVAVYRKYNDFIHGIHSRNISFAI